MATAPATAEKMTLDRSDGSATIDLYRAALGPVHTDYYLKAFTRFDAAGKAGPCWNWTAALLTLNWLLFRKLWAPALAYVGALAGTLLLLFGIGRLVFQLSDTSQWALAALAVLLALMVPGAFGNAWLFAACNKKMEAALGASASMEEACALLSQNACTRKHLGGLAAGNLTLLAAIGAIALTWPSSSALPLNTSKMEQARLATVATAESGLAAQSVAAANVASAASAASAIPAAPAASATAPAKVGAPARTSQGLVQAAAPLATRDTAPAAVAVAAARTASAPMAAHDRVAPTGNPTKAELRAKALLAKEKKMAKVAASRTADKPQTDPASAAGIFLINVGLFADENNARNAFTKLQDAGLPALSQELKAAKGVRTRVRAGPFSSQAEADSAAEKIRALRLEAAVVKP